MSNVQLEKVMGLLCLSKGDNIISIGPATLNGRKGAPDMSVMIGPMVGKRFYFTISFEEFQRALESATHENEIRFEDEDE